MDAKVTKAFDGVPDGQVMTRRIDVGETVSGDLARVAVENGWAKTPSKGRKRKADADADAAGAGDANGSDEDGGAETSGDPGIGDEKGEAEASSADD